MPKTITDDIGVALPSAIDGPFQVIDSSDAANWIKIDPALSRVEAAGDARPLRSVSTHLLRTYLSSGINAFGTYTAARSVNAGASGGMVVFPIRIPEDFDPAGPSSLAVLIGPTADSTVNGQMVRFVVDYTRVSAEDGVQADASVAMDWPVPDDWTTAEAKEVLIDNGNGWTFDGDTLAPGDWLGFRFAREGAHANDDFAQGVKFTERMVFVYRAKTF
jgi:hypothetical protein